MPKRKSSPPKKNRKKSRKNKLFQNSPVKVFAGLAILAAVVILAGLAARLLLVPEKLQKPLAHSKSIPVVSRPIAKIPTFEIYPPKEIPLLEKPEKPPLPEKHRPLVAIIIDDLGYDKKIAKKFSDLNVLLTFSILPYSPFKKSIARLARDKGFGIMLHLPMEPVEYPDVNPGPGSLLISMTPDQLIQQLEKDIDAVPFIKGVNNHMGSKMTAESGQMYQIFSVLKKKRPLFHRQPHNRDIAL